jgi:hypothetical protein
MTCFRAILCFLATSMTASAQVPRVVLPDFDPPPTEELKDPEKLAERIARNCKSVSDRLADEKTGVETLRDQKQVKQDLDALIKLLEPPPSPNSNSSSSTSSSSPPPPGSSSSESKDKKNSDSKNNSKDGQPPMPEPKGGEPMPPKPEGSAKAPAAPKAGATAPGNAGARSLPSLPFEESLARDFWGSLPDKPREQMMQFYREQYMTKYKDLLSQYYQSLTEKEKKGAK